MESLRAARLPNLSPINPNIIPPKGLAIYAPANAPRADMVDTDGVDDGKNFAPITAASSPKIAKSYHSRVLPISAENTLRFVCFMARILSDEA